MKKYAKFVIVPIIFIALWITAYLLIEPFWQMDVECIIHQKFGIYCPGCGITRSLRALLNWNIAESFKYHPSLIIAIILGFIWYLIELVSAIKEKVYFSCYYRVVFPLSVAAVAIIHCVYVNLV